MGVIGRAIGGALLSILVAGSSSALAGPDKLVNPWAGFDAPTRGAARAVGKYSAGCVLGAAALPASGPGYQVMRPSRARNYGHPDLLAFVRDLAAGAGEAGLGSILIGDLGQPRGGPAPSGHSSHQSGLDADIWFWRPSRADRRRLTRRERERIEPRPMVDIARRVPSAHFGPRVRGLLKLAASDERVARIFVNPVIKRELCSAREKGDAAWLGKVRPWWGHHKHFHVRLLCPADSDECVDQTPVPVGDGCDELDWWFREQDAADRNKGRKRYSSKVGALPELPERCNDLVVK